MKCHTCKSPCCRHFVGCSVDSLCLCAMSRGSTTANAIYLDYGGVVENGTFGGYAFEQAREKCYAEIERLPHA